MYAPSVAIRDTPPLDSYPHTHTQAHTEFRRVMREAGVKVLTVREILSYGVDSHVNARVALEDLAMRALTYTLAEDASPSDLAEADRCAAGACA